MENGKVFVIDANDRPLLPTHPGKARKLLAAGKASVVQVIPFTIRLKRVVEGEVRLLQMGIDDGAVEVGLAVVDEQRQEVVLQGVIRLRQDVPKKMEQRKNYRRARRYRQVRYRQPRFHRQRGEGWLAPTIRQKKDSVVRVVTDLRRVLPIGAIMVEQGQFNIASLASGHQLHGIDYQIPRYEGRDFRAKVLWRDRYTCQHCGARDHLQAHHIVQRTDGGSDAPDNGLTLCATCHASLHAGDWELKMRPARFHYPAHLQIGKHYLVAQLEQLGLDVHTCAGWMTSYWRTELGLDKTHEQDAIAMSCRTFRPRLLAKSYLILPKRKKIWDNNPTKVTDEKAGFRHWDVIRARHRTRGLVIGSIRSLKAKAITLRTAWDDNFPVSYSQSTLLWRFNNIIYI